jgi:hypothetical protein
MTFLMMYNSLGSTAFYEQRTGGQTSSFERDCISLPPYQASLEPPAFQA